MSPDQSIAHYRIVSKVGEGGMGAVYRATDTRLNRDVAIKVLPEAFAQDVGRMQRFEREAQVLASLNHPNIAAIYGIEQGAIVMELVEGEDLKGPVPVETAIHYARQIAIALEAAHEKGIIHRDLKPANIKVTPDGTVKLLDFGLAKASDEAVSASSAASPTMSPTLSLAMTQAGVILGTAAYMSPEQARGKPVDKRADIWAFGVVLFELLTGSAVFGGGETASDAMAAVILREPDWGALPADTPPRVRRLMERCLRKDPKQRLRDIGEARLILDEPEPVAAVAPAAPAPVAPRRVWLPWAVGGLAILGAAGAWLRPTAPDLGLSTVRFALPLPAGNVMPTSANASQAVPSPDGRHLAFIARDGSGKEALWVRTLGSTSAHRMEKTEGANFPFWSPDSQFIGFFAEEKLKRVAVSGGSVQTICEVSRTSLSLSSTGGDGGTWNQEGVIVFGNYREGPLRRVPAVGGVPGPATTLEKDDLWHSWPQFLPDGKHLLYLALNKDPANSTIYVQELGSDKRVAVLRSLTRGMWSPPGHLLFIRENALFAQRMDAKTFQLQGEPLAVAQDVGSNETNGRNAFAVSQNGVLVYSSGLVGGLRHFTWYDREGKRLSVVGPTGEFRGVSLSPDEKSAAFFQGTQAKLDAWVMDLASGALSRVYRESRDSLFSVPAWSSDSQRLAIGMYGGGIQEIALASGKASLLSKERLDIQDWSPDGRSILCSNPGGTRLLKLTPADGTIQTILDSPYRKNSFRFSRDGQYVAYSSNESGPTDIYVASFPSFTVRRKVSLNGGYYPAWSKSGAEIFYMSPDGKMMSVEIRTGSNIAAGIPKLLFKAGTGSLADRFAVTGDGKRFLLVESVAKSESDRHEINVVLNWAADIIK